MKNLKAADFIGIIFFHDPQTCFQWGRGNYVLKHIWMAHCDLEQVIKLYVCLSAWWFSREVTGKIFLWLRPKWSTTDGLQLLSISTKSPARTRTSTAVSPSQSTALGSLTLHISLSKVSSIFIFLGFDIYFLDSNVTHMEASTLAKHYKYMFNKLKANSVSC